MMLVLKKRIILIAAGVLAVLTGLSVTVSLATGYANGAGAPRLGFSVVIDAGHGGIDGGVSGVNTGIKESEINLLVAKKLEAYFKKAGVDVVMTRTNSNGLYGLSTNNFKTRDMRERERIIREAAPDIVISVHQNFFPRASQRGAQVFYKLESDASQTLAAAVRRALAMGIAHCDRVLLPGDFYILNKSDRPSILVECGFLSNGEDERLLLQPEHQEKLAYNIFLGSMSYLGAELPFFN